MNKSIFKLCITAVVSFIAGIVLTTLAFNIARWVESNTKATRQNNQTIKANAFFYSTMHAFFEGTYSSEDGSISQEALRTFSKYESKLGDKCWVDFGDEESGYHWGMAFFPSGDIFEVIIIPVGERFVLNSFTHLDWERLWSDALKRSHIN